MIVFDLILATRSPHLTGVERYGINLLKAWEEQTPAVAVICCDGAVVPQKHVRKLKLNPFIAWFLAPFFIPKGTTGILFPSFPPSPLFLLTSHKLFRIIHDTVPWDYASTMTWRGRVIFRDLENLFLFRYAQVFCPTSVAAEGLRTRFPALRTVICGNAPGLDVASPGQSRPGNAPSPGKYLLAVGTLEPRKNYEQLVKLFQQAQLAELELVIVGRDGWGGIREKLNHLTAGAGRIRLLPGATDAELRWLYANCAAFITFSKAEGFNMPLVEAGWFGRPVVASNLDIHVAVAAPWTGFLDLSDDSEIFARKIGIALQLQPSQAAVEQYRTKYSWSSVVRCMRDSSPQIKEK